MVPSDMRVYDDDDSDHGYYGDYYQHLLSDCLVSCMTLNIAKYESELKLRSVSPESHMCL